MAHNPYATSAPSPLVGGQAMPGAAPTGYPGMYPSPLGLNTLKPRLPKQPPCTVPSPTLYISNLNEKIKIPALKASLQTLYGTYGTLLDIVAHGNLRMRGQAFIVFENQEMATKALTATQGFPLFGKPMLVQYARTKSDATLKREIHPDNVSDQSDPNLEEYKRQRREEKAQRDADRRAAVEWLTATMHYSAMVAAQGGPQPGDPNVPPHPTELPASVQNLLYPGMAPTTPVNQAEQPNCILFLQRLTSEITEDNLKHLFAKFDGFKEVRLVPGRSDIAFVEYDQEDQAVKVRTELTPDYEIRSDQVIRIDYAKR
ncbi:hypothetical protein IWQ61_004029 [Dispira simplex]|nr:hypothetical protein IWQ61_004029 [Dispira simplex]